MMDVTRLVAMANDIAAFFDSDPDKEVAAEGVRLHLAKFWAPRMRDEMCTEKATRKVWSERISTSENYRLPTTDYRLRAKQAHRRVFTASVARRSFSVTTRECPMPFSSWRS